MAEIATIARPYAQALYKIAKQEGLDNWTALVSELAHVSAHPEIFALAKNPNMSSTQLHELVISTLRSPLSEEAKRFILVLIENQRFVVMPEIAQQFFALKNADHGADDVQITSAFALSEKQVADILVSLEKKFGKKLKPTVTVDANLIGGIHVQIGDEVLDTSVRRRLMDMQNSLVA